MASSVWVVDMSISGGNIWLLAKGLSREVKSVFLGAASGSFVG